MATLTTWDEFTSGGRPQDGTIRELVLSEVANVVSRRRPLLAILDNISVSNTYVEVLEDVLAARGHNATLEGAAATDPALSQPARLFTHIQSFSDWGYVSDEQELVSHYNEDPFVYQGNKLLSQVMNDIEHTFHRGSAATGATDVGRQTVGLLNLGTTPTFTDSSGTTFTESVMVDLLQLFKDNTFDITPSVAMVNSWLKRTISEFSTKVTRNVAAADRTQTLIVERHTSDFGDVDVFYTEDQLKSSSRTSSGNSVIFMDPDFFQKGWLRMPMMEELPRDGLRRRLQINAQCGLVFRTKKALGGGTGYIPYISTE